jgi:hypothetical protein
MSLVGLNCYLVPSVADQLCFVVIRAASQPLQRSSDLSKVRILVEHLNTGHREWISLSNNERYRGAYVEDQLVWARRVLPSEVNNPVAWPAKVVIQL